MASTRLAPASASSWSRRRAAVSASNGTRRSGLRYSKSAEGRFAPLKRVRRGAPEIRGFNPVVYTPTFIVVRSGEEIGRITGYPGQDYFWSELTPILATAGFVPSIY